MPGIELYVESFRGIKKAHLTCAPLGLLIAENDAGKSSVSQAVAATLTGIGLDKQFELTLATAGQLVRDGAPLARCVIRGPHGEARMSWPEAKRSQTGAEAPQASIYAAGLASIPEMKQVERANALAPYLKSLPDKPDLQKAMEEKFTQQSIDNLWEEIKAKGWDNAAATWEIARRDAGRDWRRITGENFGSDRAANWVPPGIDPMSLAFSVEDLRKQVSEARAAVDGALALSAIDDAELSRLRASAGELDARITAVSEAILAVDTARSAKEDAIKIRQALPVTTVAAHALVCPHCQGKVVLREGSPAALEAYQDIDEGMLKARRLAIADADGDVANKTAAHTDAAAALRVAETAREDAIHARDKLAASADKKSGSPTLLATARETLAARERDLALLTQRDDANAAFIRWMSANLKLALLVPEGLRAVTLGKVIDIFNKGVLAPLCEVAQWPPISFTTDLSISVDNRLYPLVSAGMKWRARFILQAAQATLDGSTMLIIDDLPDLDSNARNGLFLVLQHIERPALICMARIDEVAIRDLAEYELGGTWIIQEAETRPFGQVS
jgi:hypothetical protein